MIVRKGVNVASFPGTEEKGEEKKKAFSLLMSAGLYELPRANVLKLMMSMITY